VLHSLQNPDLESYRKLEHSRDETVCQAETGTNVDLSCSAAANNRLKKIIILDC